MCVGLLHMLVIGRYSCAGDTGTPLPDIVLPWIVLLMRTVGFFAGGLCSQLGEGLMDARQRMVLLVT